MYQIIKTSKERLLQKNDCDVYLKQIQNEELLHHYVNIFHGEIIGMIHPYQFAIDENAQPLSWRCMIMNGQMKRYKESLARTPEPIMLSQCPQIKLDLRGMMKYAKSIGKKVVELTEEEKSNFIQKKK